MSQCQKLKAPEAQLQQEAQHISASICTYAGCLLNTDVKLKPQKGKLDSHYEGPYEVVNWNEDSSVAIVKGGWWKTSKVAAARLFPYKAQVPDSSQ